MTVGGELPIGQADAETGTMLLYLLQLLTEATACVIITVQVASVQFTEDAGGTIPLRTFLLHL